MDADAYWRRPDDPEPNGEGDNARPAPPDGSPTALPGAPGSGYTGPPPSTPPPAEWRPPTVVEPPPPRSMPGQDAASTDVAEASARTVTYGIGLLAGAIVLVIICLLCARVVF